jgi:hypothetical protein
LITDFLAARWFGRQIVWTDVADRLISVWWVQLVLLLAAVVLIRRFLIRMGEPDRRPDSVQR